MTAAGSAALGEKGQKSSLRQLLQVGLACAGGHEHLILRGRSKKHKMAWTAVAESYPLGVCRELAMAVADAAASADRTVSSCVLDAGKRIGEARVPGPARRRPVRLGSLFDVELVEQNTVRLRVHIWDTFKLWLREALSESAVSALFSCAQLLALVLRDYADILYQTGASLGSYRQLLAHSQKIMPLLRPHLKPAWDMVSRWEELEPVVRRTPLLEVILQAMVGIALALRWRCWAAVTLATFYAIARPGELLHARRRNVLTPLDLLEPEHSWIYIKIDKPKSRRRGAKVQHIKLCEPAVVTFLERTWQALGPQELLYPGSPGVYRRRWDRILQILGAPTALGLTPASLRAGGAVTAFRKGTAVSDLLWRMRLQSLATLEYYLQ